jgi:hypothetical protein
VPGFFIADGGITRTSNRGLYVRAAGANPTTGEPAFTKSSSSDFDHVRWIALRGRPVVGANPCF